MTAAAGVIRVVAHPGLPRDMIAFVQPLEIDPPTVELTPGGFVVRTRAHCRMQVFRVVRYNEDADCYASGDDWG